MTHDTAASDRRRYRQVLRTRPDRDGGRHARRLRPRRLHTPGASAPPRTPPTRRASRRRRCAPASAAETRSPSPTFNPLRSSWTSAPAAVSMSCCPPGGSDPQASPTAWMPALTCSTLARANAAKAGVANAQFLHGRIEAIPLPDGHVDVIISNCVINLSADKARVLAEAFRVLRPGGRLGISDMIADDGIDAGRLADAEQRSGCISGTLTVPRYRDMLTAAGFGDITITATHPAGGGVHSAIIRAARPTAPARNHASNAAGPWPSSARGDHADDSRPLDRRVGHLPGRHGRGQRHLRDPRAPLGRVPGRPARRAQLRRRRRSTQMSSAGSRPPLSPTGASTPESWSTPSTFGQPAAMASAGGSWPPSSGLPRSPGSGPSSPASSPRTPLASPSIRQPGSGPSEPASESAAITAGGATWSSSSGAAQPSKSGCGTCAPAVGETTLLRQPRR